MSYKSPIDVVIDDMQLQLRHAFDDAIVRAVQNVNITVDKDELIKALKYDRQEYDRGYADGEWEMFSLITSVFYGKGCYFLDDDGMVYSRLSGKTLRNIDEALNEWLSQYEE